MTGPMTNLVWPGDERAGDLCSDEAETTGNPAAALVEVLRGVLTDVSADGACWLHEHVDRSLAGPTDLTKEFQDVITTYAWGGIWTRPGLDRRSRSMITLTALVADGHHEELALHLREARRDGLSWDEIKEVLLQTAIYCGVPSANTAFRIALQVRGEEGQG